MSKWQSFGPMRGLLAIAFAAIFAAASCRASVTVTSLEGPTYAVGATYTDKAYDATSADPLAPFNGQSVTFEGYQTGGSGVELSNAFLRFEYEIVYSSPVTLKGLVITEAGDFRADSVLELLDYNENVIASEPLSASTVNVLNSFAFPLASVEGSKFFLEQFDRSTTWTYVQNITLLPEPSLIGLLVVGACGVLGNRRMRKLGAR
jgi:hypothetical protein